MRILPAASRFYSLVALVTMLLPGLARAGGVGAYVEYPRGDQTVELQFGDQSFTNNRIGVGLVLDSNVARNELIHVRASLGYVYTENTVDDVAHGGAFDFAIGMGFWRTPKFRVWAAPIIRLGVDYYDNPLVQVLDFGVGGGLQLGVNWHVSPRVSVSPSIAYQYLYVREIIKDDFSKDQLNGREQLITARLTFLFRDRSDLYRPRPRSGRR